MALPKIDQPTYKLTIPSTEQEIRYRPFTVKEEKILLMARQDGDSQAIYDATTQIINNCIVEGDVNLKKLASFDVEYIFLSLRARSMGELVDLIGRCEECEADIPFQIDLNEVEVKKDPEHTSDIKITDTVGVIMRYPLLADITKISTDDEVQAAFKLIATCIESIYDGDTITNTRDESQEDVQNWVESLSQDQFIAIRRFMETMPKLILSKDLVCPKCENKQTVQTEGLANFFR